MIYDLRVRMKTFLQRFFAKFVADDTTTLAASLSFYTALSLAPLMILFVTVSAMLSVDLRHAFIAEMQHLAGEDAAAAIQMVVEGVANQGPRYTSAAGMAGLITVIVSASLIFGQLRYTLNRIFFEKTGGSGGKTYFKAVLCFVQARALQMVLACVSILILIASVYVSVFLYSTLHIDDLFFKALLSFVVSVFFYVVLFTLLFRFLPDRRLSWKKAFEGGSLTATLFAIGKELIAIYLSRSGVGSSYGNAGSIIVLLVWVYYSSLITLIGAQVISVLHGRGKQPS